MLRGLKKIMTSIFRLSEWAPGRLNALERKKTLIDFAPRNIERAKPVQQLKPLGEEVKRELDFKKGLSQQMARCGKSQHYIAQVAGVSDDCVYRWVRGDRTPKLEVIVEIAWALECSVDDLIFGN